MKILLFILLVFIFSSCNVFKSGKTVSHDSVAVSRIDTGSVKKAVGTELQLFDYDRETAFFAKENRPDTTIVYPVKVVRERGKSSIQKEFYYLDSGFMRHVDSLFESNKQTETKEKTSVLNFWQIIALSLGAVLILIVLINLFLNEVNGKFFSF